MDEAITRAEHEEFRKRLEEQNKRQGAHGDAPYSRAGRGVRSPPAPRKRGAPPCRTGARDAKPRTAVAHRHGQWGGAPRMRILPCIMRGGNGGRARAVRTAMWRGGAMGTSRPTATGHECGARAWSTRRGRGVGARRGGAAWGARLRNMPSNGLFHGSRDGTEPWRRKTTAKGMGFGDE